MQIARLPVFHDESDIERKGEDKIAQSLLQYVENVARNNEHRVADLSGSDQDAQTPQLRVIGWHGERESRSLTEAALDPDLTAVGTYQFLSDSKSQPQAA